MVQRRVVVIPTTVTASRMQAIAKFDTEQSCFSEHRDTTMVKWFADLHYDV
ncbi:hypothetical protein [Shewanella sp.]|uniref:hypothetical protein n=1 Tax=Shewanella sp. TaxID=50422 RepID=UPI003A981EEE